MDKLIMDRRRFLKGSAAAIGLTTTASVLPARHQRLLFGGVAAADTPESAAMKRSARYLASDGLLVNFVKGQLVSVTGPALVVSAPGALIDAVSISIKPTTSVVSRAARAKGQLDPLIVGDEVSVGTSILANGTRQARWIVANPVIREMVVSGPQGESVLGHERTKDGVLHGDRPVGVTLTSATNLDFRSEDLGGRPVNVPSVIAALNNGDRLYFTGSASAPRSAASCWAMYVLRLAASAIG